MKKTILLFLVIAFQSAFAQIKFKVNDKAEALYAAEEKWYAVKITADNGDGTYSVMYDVDGFQEAVTTDKLRKATGVFNAGDNVDALASDNKWHPSKITSINKDNSIYTVKFDEDNTSAEVTKDQIKKQAVTSEAVAVQKTETKTTAVKSKASTSANTNTVVKPKNLSAYPKYQLCEKVKTAHEYGSTFIDGKIIKDFENGMYLITSTHSTEDFVVTADMLQKVEQPAPKARSTFEPIAELSTNFYESAKDMKKEKMKSYFCASPNSNFNEGYKDELTVNSKYENGKYNISIAVTLNARELVFELDSTNLNYPIYGHVNDRGDDSYVVCINNEFIFFDFLQKGVRVEHVFSRKFKQATMREDYDKLVLNYLLTHIALKERKSTLTGKNVSSLIVETTTPEKWGLNSKIKIAVTAKLADGTLLKSTNSGGDTPLSEYKIEVAGGTFDADENIILVANNAKYISKMN